MNLNQQALHVCERIVEQQTQLRVAIECGEGGARLIDCGVNAPGGLEAGRVMAEVCLAGLGRVDFVPGNPAIAPGPAVAVATDHPVTACMASQYAGWPIGGESFFAMGSGPMRAVRGREPLFDKIGCLQKSREVVGVLETGKTPNAEICVLIAEDCHTTPQNVTLLFAPTSSIAGTVQIVARSIETALHKMHELDFDLAEISSGFGTAPLPPVSASNITGIGRTNDAVLYGGEVTLWVRADDRSLESLGPQIPSNSSREHGESFGSLFERHDRDFYKIDPSLFSPAVVTLVNLESGKSFRFGEFRPDILRQSFATKD